VKVAGLAQSLATEIQADGPEAEVFEQGSLMAASAAWHQHPALWLGRQRMAAQELGQGRGGLPQFPAIAALSVALVPSPWIGDGGLIGGVHESSMPRSIAACV